MTKSDKFQRYFSSILLVFSVPIAIFASYAGSVMGHYSHGVIPFVFAGIFIAVLLVGSAFLLGVPVILRHFEEEGELEGE